MFPFDICYMFVLYTLNKVIKNIILYFKNSTNHTSGIRRGVVGGKVGGWENFRFRFGRLGGGPAGRRVWLGGGWAVGRRADECGWAVGRRADECGWTVGRQAESGVF
jgi:hypothetical protein